jgi:tRNA 2-thiouridine synthesizing protein A
MSDEEAVTRTLDARGLYCPMPIVKINKTVKEMKSGEVIKVLCTDPGSERDFQSWCEKTGNKLLKMSEEDGVFIFIIQKSS